MVKKLLYILLFLLISSPVFAVAAGNDTVTAPPQKQSVFDNSGVNSLPVQMEFMLNRF